MKSLEHSKKEEQSMMIMENRQRLDLTEWIIHFVHERKPKDNFEGLYEDLNLLAEELDVHQHLTEYDFRLCDYYDESGKEHFVNDTYIENEYDIDAHASAFEVLKKILHDGFIHSSWSLRNLIPSIYGPKSAVCLTEMPLYALLEYAKVRGERSGYVGNYELAFKRNELFDAGARPVIYGLRGLLRRPNMTKIVCIKDVC